MTGSKQCIARLQKEYKTLLKVERQRESWSFVSPQAARLQALRATLPSLSSHHALGS
jgi:hypothetical protein